MKFVVLLLFFGTSVCTAIDERPNALLVTTIGQTSQLIGSKASSGKLEVGDFVISKTGLLQFKSKTNAFRLLPLVKFPGELISITILDHQDQVYVARFVEPGGGGVEGYYDICFRTIDGQVLAGPLELSGSLERVSSNLFLRSSAYVYDRYSKTVLRINHGPPTSPVPMLITNNYPLSVKE